MYSDICFDYCVVGSGEDGVSCDAVLCATVFGVCGVDDFTVGVLVVIDFDCVYRGECAGNVSFASFTNSIGFDDGAESEIYFETSGASDYCGGDVGGSDGAVDIV